MEITLTVPDELAREAERLGMSVEQYAEGLLSRGAAIETRSSTDQESLNRAIEDMRSFGKRHGLTLGPDLTIKDLINEGRKR